MLKAVDLSGKMFLSWKDFQDINKENQYLCPECKQKVVFVNCILKIKHFRHYVKSKCDPEPETEQHIKMKEFFIRTLQLKENEIEVPLGYAKPDIMKNGIAIEVQYSKLSLQDFLNRTKQYTEHGIPVIWVFHKRFLATDNVNAVIKKAHELYYGRVYIFNYGQICPYHLEGKGRMVGEADSGYGYYFKYYKKKKIYVLGRLVDNFNMKISRNKYKDNNYLVANFTDSVFWKKKEGGDING